jgi:hypothetical protein
VVIALQTLIAMKVSHSLFTAALPLLLWAAPVPNLTGTWKLNVQKSQWGKKAAPVSVIVVIEHQEPAWKYTGTVIEANNDEKKFTYEGVIDGKERDATSGYGPGKMTMRRVNRFTIQSVFHSTDGRFTETAQTASTDGQVLTRRMNLKSPDGTVSWVEVYEKQDTVQPQTH